MSGFSDFEGKAPYMPPEALAEMEKMNRPRLVYRTSIGWTDPSGRRDIKFFRKARPGYCFIIEISKTGSKIIDEVLISESQITNSTGAPVIDIFTKQKIA